MGDDDSQLCIHASKKAATCFHIKPTWTFPKDPPTQNQCYLFSYYQSITVLLRDRSMNRRSQASPEQELTTSPHPKGFQ